MKEVASGVKPVTLDDGTPVPGRWIIWWSNLSSATCNLSRRGVALLSAIEDVARAEARVAALSAHVERLEHDKKRIIEIGEARIAELERERGPCGPE